MAFNHRKMLVYCIRTKDLNVCYHQQYLPPPPPPPLPQRELSLLLPTTIWVAGSILLFLFLVIFLYLYLTQPRRASTATVTPGNTNRRREDEEETDERELSDYHHVWRIPTVGLRRSEINSITVVGFKKGQGLIDDTECSVCLNEFEEDESLRLLPKCSHAFHINCIDTWLHSHKNCPLCRAPVLPLTKPHPHQETETNHHQAIPSESSNNLSGGQESSTSRNLHILTRAQSDLANHCGTGSVENVEDRLQSEEAYHFAMSTILLVEAEDNSTQVSVLLTCYHHQEDQEIKNQFYHQYPITPVKR